jgi:TetR/AcrR family transcriptional regulator, regulator of cefoperazone and chloramphenicol sensitivity
MVRNYSEEVRDRILSAAEELFAEKGFQGTTVQAIARRARCNLDTVNYYYSGKETLYLAVFLHRTQAVRMHVTGSLERWLMERGEAITLKMLVQEFADLLLEPFLYDLSGPREADLVVRELQDPHVPLSLYDKNLMEPIIDAMTDALRSLYPRLSDRQAILCTESIIAQLRGVLWVQMRGAGCQRHSTAVEAQERVKHLVVFCTAGIQQYLGQSPSDCDVDHHESGEVRL